MDKTDSASAGLPEGLLASRGSQSKLSAALLFVLLAALLFRIVTAVMDRTTHSEAEAHHHHPPPLLQWVPLEKAAQAAAAAGKPVLYDFSAEWCIPCHRLDEEGWGDETLAGIANQGFVPARVLDRSQEEGRNSPLVDELQRRYAVEAFPTLIAAGADGKEIARLEGWAGRDALRKFLQESKGRK